MINPWLRKKMSSSWNDVLLIVLCAHFVLVTLGLVSLSYLNLKKGTELAGSEINLDIILNPDSGESAAAEIMQLLSQDQQVRKTKWLTPEALWEDFLRAAQISSHQLKNENIFTPIVQVTLDPTQFATSAQVQAWAHAVSSLPGVQAVQGGLDWFANYFQFFQFLKFSGAFLVLGVWLLGFMLIGLIYSYSVLRQKEVIEIQSLVGATPSFIFKPIFSEALLIGFLVGVSSGIMTLSLFSLGFQHFSSPLRSLLPLPHQTHGQIFVFFGLLASSLLMSIAGCILGFWRVQLVLRQQEFSS
jgi:cell division transport system permease protein